MSFKLTAVVMLLLCLIPSVHAQTRTVNVEWADIPGEPWGDNFVRVATSVGNAEAETSHVLLCPFIRIFQEGATKNHTLEVAPNETWKGHVRGTSIYGDWSTGLDGNRWFVFLDPVSSNSQSDTSTSVTLQTAINGLPKRPIGNVQIYNDFITDKATKLDTIAEIQSLANAGQYDADYDFNGDGSEITNDHDDMEDDSSQSDLAYFIHYGCETEIGDVNLDGTVDVADLIDAFSNDGETSGMTWEDGDVNGDGAVDVADFIRIFAHQEFGTPCN